MRDWDKNGKIDGRDYYLFHEEIIKNHNESTYTPAASSYRRTEHTTNFTFDLNKKEQKEIGCLPILLINIILLLLLEVETVKKSL